MNKYIAVRSTSSKERSPIKKSNSPLAMPTEHLRIALTATSLFFWLTVSPSSFAAVFQEGGFLFNSLPYNYADQRSEAEVIGCDWYVGDYCKGDIVIPDTTDGGFVVIRVAGSFYRSCGNESCDSYDSVTIGANVEEISGAPFQRVPVGALHFSEGVDLTIGPGAFAYSGLTALNIPDRVIAIEEQAFSENQITSLTIPNSVTTIGEDAFRGNNLQDLVIGAGVESVGDRAFMENDLDSVRFEGSYGVFGDTLFGYSPQLADITYECEGTTGWEDLYPEPRSFDVGPAPLGGSVIVEATPVNCIVPTRPVVKQITPGDTSAQIQFIAGKGATVSANQYSLDGGDFVSAGTDGTFEIQGLENSQQYSVRMKSVGANGTSDVSHSVDFIAGQFEANGLSFIVQKQLLEVEVAGRAADSSATEIVIPETASAFGKTYSSTSVGSEAFINVSLASVELPDSIKTIWNRAFYNSDLEAITLPESLEKIHLQAFYQNALQNISIPEGVTYIGANAFSRNSLSSVAFNGNADGIETNIFTENTELTDVTHCDGAIGWPLTFSLSSGPGSVTSTPTACYAPGAPAIDSVLPKSSSVTVNFTKGSASETVYGYEYRIDSGIYRSAGSAAYLSFEVSGLSEATEYTIQIRSVNDVGPSIPSATFSFVTNPFTVNGLKYEAKTLTTAASVGLADDNTSTAAVIPSTVQSSGNTYSITTVVQNAFDFAFLTSVTLPDGLLNIESGAFQWNDLSEVTIPRTVLEIGTGAFSINEKLTSVSFLGDFGNFDLGMFSSNFDLQTITHCENRAGWPQTFEIFTDQSLVSVPTQCTTVSPLVPNVSKITAEDGEVIIEISISGPSGIAAAEYIATCSDGTSEYEARSSSSRIVISGLENGVQYQCAVRVVDSNGDESVSSDSSLPVTPEETVPTGLPIWLLYQATQ